MRNWAPRCRGPGNYPVSRIFTRTPGRIFNFLCHHCGIHESYFNRSHGSPPIRSVLVSRFDRKGSDSPTIAGWILQFALLCLFFLLNYWSVKTFAKANFIISIFKYVVPITVIVVLIFHFHPGNMTVHGFAPFGFTGIQAAISTGGVMFAYLGLHPIVAVASEVQNPKRNIPIALIVCIIVSTIIYTVLQLTFIGAIPADTLKHGWPAIGTEFSLPFKDIAVLLGLGWLATLVILDAILSPGGNGNIFMNTTSRLVYAWARNGTLFSIFLKSIKKPGHRAPPFGFRSVWLFLDASVPFLERSCQRMLRRIDSVLCDCADFFCGAESQREEH